jgi:hypothetical protein
MKEILEETDRELALAEEAIIEADTLLLKAKVKQVSESIEELDFYSYFPKEI